MQEESSKPCRPPNTTNYNNRYDSVHYNAASDDYPLKFVSLYTPDQEEDRADTLPPPSSIGASSSLGIFSRTRRTLTEVFVDFCDRTSSHGIPHIASSPSLIGKIIWALVFIACSIIFSIQTYWTVREYTQYRTLIEIELKFEAAAFPAVSICNLNPYKKSLLFNISLVEEWYQKYLHMRSPTLVTYGQSTNRTKRQVRYHPIHVHCRCTNPTQDCVALYNMDEPDRTTCLCFEDEKSGDIWPCYQLNMWTDELKCNNCSLTNSCELPQSDERENSEDGVPCICQKVSKKCVKLPADGIRWWKPLNYNIINHTTTTTTESPPVTQDANSDWGPPTDNAAIASDNLGERVRALLGTMDLETRQRLSYNLSELVIWCAFNAESCGSRNEMHILPKYFGNHDTLSYGNCYTFNYNRTHPLKNSRAGPTHGLRLLLNVDQPDYLPWTEAAGVRIVIHEQDQMPFPDSLGYSAPTGMISWFGLKCQKIRRTRACQKEFDDFQSWAKEHDYVYPTYSAEGCIRSCFQKLAIQECGCGEPKFLVAPHQRICYWNETGCLKNFTVKFGRLTNDIDDKQKKNPCQCEQPCKDTTYQTSYSAATWPADNYLFGRDSICTEEMLKSNNCTEYVRKNTALIEIFFEQLSYEDLSEREAYSIINLLADFGGNIGLWIGFSVITFVEFLELAVELMVLCYNRTRASASRRKKPRFTRPVAFQYINRAVEESFHEPSTSMVDSDRSSIAAQASKN